jgi:transcriptional regulator with XRE-family HTH domain
MRKIGAIIEAKQITQVEAGRLVGMDQPRMSALMRGKITKFSTDRLIRALNDLGHDIELRIRPAPQPKGVIKIVGGKSSRPTKTNKKRQAA